MNCYICAKYNVNVIGRYVDVSNKFLTNSGLVVLQPLPPQRHPSHLLRLQTQPKFLLWVPLLLLIPIGGSYPDLLQIHPELYLAELRHLVGTILCQRTWFNLHLRCLHLPLPMEAVIIMFRHKPTIKELSSLSAFKFK